MTIGTAFGKGLGIIGLIGAAGSGKTSFADRLVSAYGFRSYSFAAPLKRLCAEQYGWDVEQLDSLPYKEEQAPGLAAGWTRRRVLQHIGTEGFRHIDPEHWVKRALRELGDLGPRVVLPDVRFPNEVAALRSMGGVIVALHRHATAAGTGASEHESEQLWRQIRPDFSWTLLTGLEHIAWAVDRTVARLTPPDACCPYGGKGEV